MNLTVADWLQRSGVPPRFAGSRLSTFDPTRSDNGGRALDWALGMAPEPRSGLLCGNIGTGKTHLVVGILAERRAAWLTTYPDLIHEEARPEGRVVVVERPFLRDLFVDVPALLDEMRSWIAHPDGPDPINDYIKANLLVLDDLGRERVTDWASERLYVLINTRYGEQRPTIATSNLKPSELVEGNYGPIVSRLIDGSKAVWLGGKDQRAA